MQRISPSDLELEHPSYQLYRDYMFHLHSTGNQERLQRYSDDGHDVYTGSTGAGVERVGGNSPNLTTTTTSKKSPRRWSVDHALEIISPSLGSGRRASNSGSASGSQTSHRSPYSVTVSPSQLHLPLTVQESELAAPGFEKGSGLGLSISPSSMSMSTRRASLGGQAGLGASSVIQTSNFGLGSGPGPSSSATASGSGSASGSHYKLRRLSVSSSSGDGHANVLSTLGPVEPTLGLELNSRANMSTVQLLLGTQVDSNSGPAHYSLRRKSRDAGAGVPGVGPGAGSAEDDRWTGWAHHGDTQFMLGPPVFPVASGSRPSTSSLSGHSAHDSGSGGYNSTSATNGSDSDPRSGLSTPTRPTQQVQGQAQVHVQGRPGRPNSAATTTSRTRPIVSPLIIPDQPVFSSYPVISGRTSSLTTDEDELDTPTRWQASPRSAEAIQGKSKGRRRLSSNAGIAGYSVSDRGHGQGHPITTSRYKRRSPSLHVLPSASHRSDSVGENPLAHTWGRDTFVAGLQGQYLATASASQRKRRATVSNNPQEFVFGTLGDELKRGQLPPGAMPAIDPARQSDFFHLSPVDGRRQVWGRGEPPSAERITVPRRTSSLKVDTRPKKSPIKWSTPDHKTTEKPATQPFVYVPGSDVNYTLHAIPGGLTGQGRPLVSPAPSSHSKSQTHRSGDDFFTSKPVAGSSVLGLDDEGLPSFTLRAERPPLNQSGETTQPEAESRENVGGNSFEEDHDQMPSLTGTSSGAGTAEVMLSSASTSLSRSTKNAKEGADKEQPLIVNPADPSVDMHDLTKALRDRLAVRVARSDRRKYQLVELVETEVAYTSHLRDLVEIFLPQLAALSCITESDHKAISRNLGDMLYFHDQFSARMVEVLKEEHLGTEADLPTPVDEPARTERMIRKVSAVFIEDASGLEIYNQYCAGTAAAMDIIRAVHHRPEWHSFEKRCRIVAATRVHKDLYSMLREENPSFVSTSVPPATLSSMPSRLYLRDLLILPVQRICRYPLVLHSLSVSGGTPSPALEDKIDFTRSYDVGVDPARALAVAKMAASRADEANRRSIRISRTKNIAKRLEYHPVVTKTLLAGLGPCVLAGALDVLYHHHSLAPLHPPLRVKYYGAFVYNGFMLLVKAKKTSYEIKHFLPLEMFELIDVTEGFLPYSIRLIFLDHQFELATTCQQEKDVWAAALCAARDEAGVLPFDLPCSVLLRSNKSRRESVLNPAEMMTSPVKRNSLALYEPADATPSTPLGRSAARGEASEHQDDVPFPTSPVTPATPLHRQMVMSGGTPQSILLRRASPWHRAVIDDYLIFSEEISLARMSSEQSKTMPSPGTGSGPIRNRLSMRDSSVLKRRRSYVDFNGLGHTRTVSTSSQKEDNRMSYATVSSKRSSLAGSIKRGLSLSSHDGQDPWASTPMLISGTTLSSPVVSHTPLAVPTSPVNMTASALPYTLTTSTEKPRAAASRDDVSGYRHVRSRSQGLPSQLTSVPAPVDRQALPRKQSLTRLSSLFGRPKTERAYSLPSSPSVPRLPDVGVDDDTTPNDRDIATGGYFDATHHNGIYASGAGFSNVRPGQPTQSTSFMTRSMSFVKLASKGKGINSNPNSECGGYDSRRNSVDTDPLASSVYSTPSGDPRGLESVPGSPSELPALPIVDDFGAPASQAVTHHGRRSNASSEYGTDTSSTSKAEAADRRPDQGRDIDGTKPNQPKRRRSVRFFSSIKGLTSITGNPG